MAPGTLRAAEEAAKSREAGLQAAAAKIAAVPRATNGSARTATVTRPAAAPAPRKPVHKPHKPQGARNVKAVTRSNVKGVARPTAARRSKPVRSASRRSK